MMVVNSETEKEINLINMAKTLVNPFVGRKSRNALIEIDEKAKFPSYSENTLIIPEPGSLNEAIFSVLYASLLFDEELGTEDVPRAIKSLTSALADQVETQYRNSLEVTEMIKMDEKGAIIIPYRYSDVINTKVTFVVLRDRIEMQTVNSIWVKMLDEEAEIQKPFLVEMKAFYDTSMNFKLRLRKRLRDITSLVEGSYRVYRI
ncbi:hypothetical protein LLE49_19795 [Alicyclobacillus tolerans]|uniref:hypothetical protein n=1 Tax=Alicyclobacillus tolerans TaxID=90970 RepID=UPI001F2D3C22|nr:hypothetical protein [Alicyclobacillus tolerans]MCF8566967.1 hypothetical protein [Alicyclobacillus tolerans]